MGTTGLIKLHDQKTNELIANSFFGLNNAG